LLYLCLFHSCLVYCPLLFVFVCCALSVIGHLTVDSAHSQTVTELNYYYCYYYCSCFVVFMYLKNYFNHLMTLPRARLIRHQMEASKLDRMLREMVVAQLEIISCCFPGGTAKTTENLIHDIRFPGRGFRRSEQLLRLICGDVTNSVLCSP
jgi:hypothetical protein